MVIARRCSVVAIAACVACVPLKRIEGYQSVCEIWRRCLSEGGNESRCGQKCEQLCFHSYLSLGNSTAKDNGREPNAPSPEAPRSALQEDASSRARLGACLMRSLALKIRGFLMRLAAEATQDSICYFTYLIGSRHPAQSLLAGLSPASRSWIDFNLTSQFCPRLKR